MMARMFSYSMAGNGAGLMSWNKQPIPYSVALQIGWNLPMDVVGADGGIAKRDASGKVMVGDEWPEDNLSPPAHNPVHSTGPYLDYSYLTAENRGYSKIASVIISGSAPKLEALLESAGDAEQRRKLANLVMAGGARPLHMCGMSRGGDASEMIRVLIEAGADVNAKDNYEMTPVDRLASNSVTGNQLLRKHGAKRGGSLPRGQPAWDSEEYAYLGPGDHHEPKVEAQ